MSQGLDNLLEIDFLPVGYRQREMNRRASIWRAVAGVSIISFFIVIGQLQRSHHAQVRAELAAIDSQFLDAATKNGKFAEITTNLRTEQRAAELLTFLRHRWPHTQIMAAIVEPLPDSVVLTEWHTGQETIPNAAPPAVALPEANAVPSDKPGKRAGDLKRLLAESNSHRHFVFLAGTAAEAAALHAYLAKLGTNPLFSHVDLVALEHVTANQAGGQVTETMHFTARAMLQMGHGQTVPVPPTDKTNATPLARQGG